MLNPDSILDSVKEQLGLIEVDEFDSSIIMCINGAISTLSQIGVGPSEGFVIIDKENTYEEYLGKDHPAISQVKLYLFYKTKLEFDPPQSTAVMEVIKEMIAECEWRLNVMCDTEIEGGDKK